MVTHTYQARKPAPIEITVEDFVKAYEQAEKNAIVSAGGMAFNAEDRINLNAMREALGLDFTRAADAVTKDPATYTRHWQRFHHWAKQIKKGSINVAPPADEIADRTHKSRRVVKAKNQNNKQKGLDHLPIGTKKEIAQVIVNNAESHADAERQLGIVFDSREQAQQHLQDVCYGLVRLGMTDADGLSAQLKAAMGRAEYDLRVESEAQRIIRQMEAAGITRNDLDRVMSLAKQLMPE